jgi:hypothetical protein
MKTQLLPCVSGGLLLVLIFAGSAPAQTYAPPHLLFVSPPGGKAGTSFDVTVTGQNLEDAAGLFFSQAGIKAEYLGGGGASTAKPSGMKKPNPKGGPQRSMKFRVTVAGEVRPGFHDLRLVTRGGISNPRAFVVGDLKEFVETEPNDDVPQAQTVDLNCTVSGVISNPTDVDYFAFSGKKGQRVVVSCLTTSIDSKLPASVEIYSSSGSYLGSGRGYRDNDALADCVLPADGDYHVRIASFTYTAGGPEYFYRLTISTAPWIDAVFPAVIEPGRTAEVAVYGRNLPGGKLDPDSKVDGRVLEKATVSVKAPADALPRQRLDFTGFLSPSASGLDGFEFRLRNDAGISNPVLLTYAAGPVVLDQGDNDSVENAQKVTVPCEIAGRIEKRSDRDWYVFHANKGDVYSIELAGDRLGSPLDLYFTLRDPQGKVITEQDDANEVLSPQFFSRTFDPPRYRFTASADGDYQILVSSRDAYVQSGPRHGYQLRITPEQPDFRLITMPPANVLPQQQQPALPGGTVVGQHGNQALQVFVWRRDGFNGDIELTGKDLPPGVTVAPQVLTAAQKTGILVLSAAADARAWTGPIRVIGTAKVRGQTLVREARPATITWSVPQINIPAVSRLDRSLVLAVRDQAPFTLEAIQSKFTALPGDRITVPLKLSRNWPSVKGPVQVTALALPPALTFQNLTLAPGKDASTKAAVSVKTAAAPGMYTLVLNGQVQGVQQKGGRRVNPGGIFQPSTPISITVLPKQLAKLTVTPASAKLEPGTETTLLVKVSRLYEFDGPFAVRLVDAKGLSAEEVKIPAGRNEVKLILSAAPDMPVGNHPNVVIRATADFQGHVIVHEAKLGVNVVKGKNK